MIVGRYTALAHIEAVKRAAIQVAEVPYRALVHIEVALAQFEAAHTKGGQVYMEVGCMEEGQAYMVVLYSRNSGKPMSRGCWTAYRRNNPQNSWRHSKLVEPHVWWVRW